jgi:hypothetical protein
VRILALHFHVNFTTSENSAGNSWILKKKIKNYDKKKEDKRNHSLCNPKNKITLSVSFLRLVDLSPKNRSTAQGAHSPANPPPQLRPPLFIPSLSLFHDLHGCLLNLMYWNFNLDLQISPFYDGFCGFCGSNFC